MLDYLVKIKQQFMDFWQSLTKSQKAKIITGSILVFVIMFGLFYTITRTEYSILATDLSQEEANEVVKKLEEMGIKWTFGSSQTTIMVDSRHKNRARLELAMLPNTGFSFLDALNSNSGLGVTDEDKRLNWNYGKMQEIAKTLKQNPYIRDAVVILEIPKEDVRVLSNQKQPKASVQLTLERGKQLDQSQIQGIVSFIASSVIDLSPDNITLIDSSGRQLNINSPELNQNLDGRYQLQLEVQNNLQKSVKEFLETIYRPGNVDVRVSVKLDFDSRITNTRMFAPPIEGEESGLVRSLSELNELQTNSSEGGQPGVVPNTGEPINYPQGDNSSSRFEKASKDIYYELNEINEQIIKAQGQVVDIMVAVIVNKGEMEDEERRQLENLIRNSSGVDTKSVVVMNTTFEKDETISLSSAVAPSGLGGLGNWQLILGAIIAIGALATTLVFTLRKRKTQADKLMEQAAIQKEQTALQEIDIAGGEKSEVRKQIDKFVSKKPEAVAQLLKSWLNED